VRRSLVWLAVVLVAVVGLTSSGLVGVAAAQDTAPTCSSVSFSGGDGSADDPYEIENVSQLQCIEDDLDAHYELVSDVDASATSGWNDEKGFAPIGSCTEVGEADPWEECSGQQFTGTFDGNSHTVSGLTIDRPDTNGVGLFAAADEARFTNLRLASVNITGGENTGGLAGQLVSDKINTKDGFVGNVSVNGTVTGELDTAGVVGHGLDITLEDQIVFTGTVKGSDEVGGILGRSSEATAVSTSYVRATVEAKGDAQGRVYEDEAVAGGLVGNSGNPSDFTNVYTVGSVSGDVAGSIVGGGNDRSTFEDVYWDTDKGPNDAVGGYEPKGDVTQLSTAEMQGVTAEENMDFDWDGTWQSVASDYPVFQWEAAAVGESSIAGIDATDATAVVNETGGVTVVATDEFGNRLESTSISVDATDGLSGINTGDTETTDSNGQATFTFTEETAGTYALTFSADESITDTATVTIREGVNCAVVEYSGDGSTDDPYEIDSLAKLQCIKQDLDAHYELVSDVDASATSEWNGGKGFEPIGNFSQPFTGTFDGNDQNISDLYMNRTSGNIGLFSIVGEDGTIHNLTVTGVNITADDFSGGVVGINNGTLRNVSIDGDVTSFNKSEMKGIGGLVGQNNNDGTVQKAIADVTTSGFQYVGGLVGKNNGTVKHSIAHGDVSGSESVGGLVGITGWIETTGTIEQSSASGDVTGNAAVGGLAGQNLNSVLNTSSANGTVTGHSYVGGLAGIALGGQITDASATATVAGTTSVGGLVGVNGAEGRRLSGSTITNASAGGTVSVPDGAESTEYVGGLVGQLYTADVTSSTANVNIDVRNANTATYVGGLVGYANQSHITGSQATGAVNVTGSSSVGYIGGLAGDVYGGEVRDSSAHGDVAGSSAGLVNRVGGLVGEADAVENGTARGNVTVDSNGLAVGVGGLAGGVRNTVKDGTATGTVMVEADYGSGLVGGLAGILYTVSNGTATGNVNVTVETANSTVAVGGLVGQADLVKSGKATGDITVATEGSAGGIGGLLGSMFPEDYDQGRVEGSEYTGNIVVTADNVPDGPVNGADLGETSYAGIGGLAGYAFSIVDTSFDGSVTVTAESEVENVDRVAGILQENAELNPRVRNVTVDGSVEINSGNGASTSGGSSNDDDDDRSSVDVRSMAQSDAAGAQDGGSDVAPTSATGFVVSMRNVDGGEQIAVDFTEQRRPTASQPTDEDAQPTENEATPSGESAPRNVQSDGLVLTVSEEGDYELTVTARDVDVFATAAESGDGDAEPSDGEDTDSGEGESSGEVDLSTDAFDEESTRFVEATAARPVGFMTVEHTFDSDDLETATHRFRVRKSYLAATGATAESVALYREEPESYRALSTRRVGEDDAYYYFEADTPGFSTFVIGTEAPIFDLGEPTLEQADVETGVIDASVPVENIGTEPGTYTVRLRGDGVVLAETEVSVPAGETVEATVRTTAPDADGLALTVAGESLGEFTVEDSDADGSERTTDAGAQPTADAEDATQPTADAEDATDEPSDTPDGSAPGGRFIALLVAAVLVVVAVWALRRRDEP